MFNESTVALMLACHRRQAIRRKFESAAGDVCTALPGRIWGGETRMEMVSSIRSFGWAKSQLS